MAHYNVTIEDDTGAIYEGLVEREELNINDIVSIKLYTKNPQYRKGLVIMFEEINNG